MTHSYILIPRIQVQSANALSSGCIINATPITAAVLFAHAIGREIEEYVEAVGYIHHDAQHLGEEFVNQPYMPQQRRGASFIDKSDYSAKNKYALSLQPTASFHLTFSLILAFEEDSEADASDVSQVLFGKKFAGGQIVDMGKPVSCDSLSELKQLIPNGYWLIDRMDLVPQSNVLIEDYIKIIGTKQKIDAEQDAPKKEQALSWLVMTNLGFAPLSKPIKKDYVREGYNHYFSEPLIGLVQYISTRSYFSSFKTLPFWRYEWTPEDAFIMTTGKLDPIQK